MGYSGWDSVRPAVSQLLCSRDYDAYFSPNVLSLQWAPRNFGTAAAMVSTPKGHARWFSMSGGGSGELIPYSFNLR